MYKSYVPYLQHILEECHYVRSVITDQRTLMMIGDSGYERWKNTLAISNT